MHKSANEENQDSQRNVNNEELEVVDEELSTIFLNPVKLKRGLMNFCVESVSNFVKF
jgi:hypothetical protein